MSVEATQPTQPTNAPQPQDEEAGAFSNGSAASEDGQTAADDEDSRVAQFLEPLTKERIIQLFAEISKQQPQSLDAAIAVLAREPEAYKLFIRSIGYDLTEESLQSIFSTHGEIQELALIKDDEGRSRGYAFLTFRNPADAITAKSAIREVDGREVHVHWAAEKQRADATPESASALDRIGDLANDLPQQRSASPGVERTQSPGSETAEQEGQHSRRGSINGVEMLDPVTECKLFVRNMPFDTSDDELRRTFEPYGKVVDASMVMDRKTGKSKGYGFVVYSCREEAQAALADPVKNINGRPAYCNLAVDRRDHRQMVHGIYQPYMGPQGNQVAPPHHGHHQQQPPSPHQMYGQPQPAYAQNPSYPPTYSAASLPYLTSPPMYAQTGALGFSPPGPTPRVPPSPQFDVNFGLRSGTVTPPPPLNGMDGLPQQHQQRKDNSIVGSQAATNSYYAPAPNGYYRQ